MVILRKLSNTILISLILMILSIPQLSANNYNFDVYLKLKGLSTERLKKYIRTKKDIFGLPHEMVYAGMMDMK